MNTTVWTNLPFEVDFDKITQYLHIDDDEDMLEEFRPVYDKCLSIANPKIAWRVVATEPIDNYTTKVDGVALKSRVMRVNFENHETVVPYVMTCGRELYEYSMSESDQLTRYWIDMFSEMVLRSAGKGAMERIHAQTNVKHYSAMNPGSLRDFPIPNQKPLFAMLGDVRELIGVELTESFLMLPHKSGSGILFSTDGHYENCSLCPREDCPNRRAKFDEKLFNEKYQL